MICTHFPSVSYIKKKKVADCKTDKLCFDYQLRYVVWFFSKFSKLLLAPTQPASRAHPASYLIGNGGAFPGDKAASCVNVATKFYLLVVPNLIMRGTVLPLAHTPLRRADG